MTCKICGKKLPEGSTVCKYCGAHIRGGASGTRYSKKGMARKRTINALMIVLALLVIGGVIAAIAWSVGKAGDQPNEAENTVQTPPETEEPAEQEEPAEPEEKPE